MAAKRLYFPSLGEYYDDCLKVEAALKRTSLPVEAASLLRHKLMERDSFRERMVNYVGRKRGLSFWDTWDLLLSGNYVPTAEELEAFQQGSEE